MSAFLVCLLELALVPLALGFPVSRFEVSSDRLVDLSYAFDNNTPYWPNIPSPVDKFNLTAITNGVDEHGAYYRSKWFRAAEHGGTHLDAPSHYSEHGLDASQLSLDQLSGHAVILNVSEQAHVDPDYQVTVRDILDWEGVNGPMPAGAFVFMNSGWSAKWPDHHKIFGSNTPTNTSSLHFPGFHPNTTKYLIAEKGIRGVGVDTPSTDRGQTSVPSTHLALAADNLIGLENVANLDKMPAAGGYVWVMPMKTAGGSGAPVRIIGILPKYS